MICDYCGSKHPEPHREGCEMGALLEDFERVEPNPKPVTKDRMLRAIAALEKRAKEER